MSPGCAEGIEDPTCRWEGIQGTQPLVVGSAADEACTAGGTARPALGDRKAGRDVAVGSEAVDDGGRCRSAELQRKAQVYRV